MSRDYLPDVHEEEPVVKLPLTSVGVKGYNVRVNICGKQCETRELVLEIYVDLPHNKRGVHMSRFIDVVKELSKANYASISSFLRRIAYAVLEKHEYSSHVSVQAGTSLIVENGNVVNAKCGVFLDKYGYTREFVEASFKGVTACPCVQKVYSYVENTVLENTPTHLQRTLLRIHVNSDSELGIDPIELYRVGKEAFSGLLTDLLKRYDEYVHVKRIVGNPKFVEDVVRQAVFLVYREFRNKLSRNAKIVVEAISEESIHVYDTYAYVETSIDELEEILS